MASLTRSASLTDLAGRQEGKRVEFGGSRTSFGSPPHKEQTDHDQFQQQTAPSMFHGNSVAGNAPLNNWKWLSSSKSFHETLAPPKSGAMFVTHSEAAAATRAKPKVIRPRFLEHLETLLPQYCIHLSHPTYQEAASAMSLLLNCPPPALDVDSIGFKEAGSPSFSLDDRPKSLMRQKGKEDDAKTSVKSEMNRILASPFRKRKPQRNKLFEEKDSRWGRRTSSGGSRFASLRTNSSISSVHSADQSNATKAATLSAADEAAWKELVTPLILLAGAEAIYADLEHVHPPTIIHWAGLYQRVTNELLSMLPPEERDALLISSKQQEETTPASSPGILSTPPASPQLRPSTKLSPKSKSTSPIFPHVRADIAAGDLAPSTPTRTNLTSTSILTPIDNANIKYKRLHSLLNFLDLKCQWLPFHESMFLTWSSDNLIFLRAFAAALPPLSPTKVDGNAATGSIDSDYKQALVEALREEIQASAALMEMAFWLERGRFLETIVSARKVKQHLVAMHHKETALVLWMRTTFQDYLSIMPLVFDRVHTFATPLYGFDQQILLEATQGERTFLNDRKSVVDLDSLVVDFLRRQEKAGGAAMAVAIVLDTDGLEDDDEEGNPTASANKTQHRIELGFSFHRTTAKQQTGGKRSPSPHASNQSPQQGVIKPGLLSDGKEWPSIYLRSTMRLSAQGRGTVSGPGLGLISGMRRVGSTNMESSASTSQYGSGIITNSSRASWSSDSPRSKHRKSPAPTTSVRSLYSHGNVFEYEAESNSRPSWPHSDWNQLRALLETLSKGPGTANIVTDQAPAHEFGDTHLKNGGMLEPMAVTFHQYPDGAPADEGAANSSTTPHALFETSRGLFASDLPTQLWDPLPTTGLSLGGGTAATNHAPTTFHAVHLSNYMWMIVMVKGEEESRWHRRKARGLSDYEIRAFLNDMASKLRVSNRFLGLKTCQTARVKVKDSLAPRVRARDCGLRDAQWQTANPEDDDQVQEEVLQLMKEAFSVSSTTIILNRAESILTTMSGFRTGGSRSPRDHRRSLALQRMIGPYADSSDYREGAALMFLGPELFRQFLESTNE